MKSESIIKGVSIGISTAILWSIVLNSKVVGIGVGICLGMRAFQVLCKQKKLI